MNPISYFKLSSFKLPDDVKDKLIELYHENYDLYLESFGELSHTSHPIDPDTYRWLNENIAEAAWFVTLFRGEVEIHKDPRTSGRILCPILTGGEHVLTRFYNEDKDLMESVKLEEGGFYLLKTDHWHDVTGIEPGQLRMILTCRTHGYYL